MDVEEIAKQLRQSTLEIENTHIDNVVVIVHIVVLVIVVIVASKTRICLGFPAPSIS